MFLYFGCTLGRPDELLKHAIPDQLPCFPPSVKNNLGTSSQVILVRSLWEALLYQSSGATQSAVHTPMSILHQLLVHDELSTNTECV